MTDTSPLVVVIIPHWNNKHILDDCLVSLKESSHTNIHVVVVDNASTDDSPAYIGEKYPWVDLVQRDENGGYAAALNTGIRHVSALQPVYYLALNNDTIIPPETISQLIAVMEADAHIAVAAPKIIYHDNPEIIFSLGDRIYPWLPLPIRYGRRHHDRSEYQKVMEFDYIFGCALLIRASVLPQVGLFDTSYFMFYEDADFCHRVRDAGWRIVRVGSAIIRHKASLSVKQQKPLMVYYRARNRSFFYRRYRHGPNPVFTAAALAIGSAWTIVKQVFSWRIDEISPYIKGVMDGLHMPVPLPTDTEFDKQD